MLLRLFWNPTERRLRAGWRILIQGTAFWLLLNALQVLIFDTLQGNLLRFAYPLNTILVSLLALWLGARWLDRRRLADYGLHFNRRWWQDLAFGLLLGALLMALIFWIEWAAGWVTVEDTFHGTGQIPFWLAIAFGLWQFVAVAINEELLSRGYHLRNLAEGLNLAPIGPKKALLLAYLLSSATFGLFHMFNNNATWISTSLLVVAGLLLGLAAYLTGELAIPIGLHITWNFFQGRVFGFPVSGTKSASTVLWIQQSGPELWTGGNFGPEAGLVGLFAMLLGCALIWGYLRLRERASSQPPQ